jgi:hypothetical protein
VEVVNSRLATTGFGPDYMKNNGNIFFVLGGGAIGG